MAIEKLPWWIEPLKFSMSVYKEIRPFGYYPIYRTDIPPEDDVKEYFEDLEIDIKMKNTKRLPWSRKAILKLYPHEYAQGYIACRRFNGNLSDIERPYTNKKYQAQAWAIGWNDYYVLYRKNKISDESSSIFKGYDLT